MSGKSWTHHRARVAVLSRVREADDPELVEARKDLFVARVEVQLDEASTRLGSLSPEQRDRLTERLWAGQ